MADENMAMDVKVRMEWTEPGATKPHYVEAGYPDKGYDFISEAQRRLVKGLQTPS